MVDLNFASRLNVQKPHQVLSRAPFIMSSVASSSLRQVSRLCRQPKSVAGGLQRTSLTARTVGITNQRVSNRTYVSESKRDNASVNVDTAIRAEQKAFFKETGKLPENQQVSGTAVNADAMMSPIAGVWPDQGQ